MCRAGGGEDESLSAGINRVAAVAEHEVPQFLPDLGSAGFTAGDHGVPAGGERISEQGQLGGFAGAIAAFKDDKKPGCGAVTHTRAVCGAGGVTQRILHPI